jgi:hypothetical protein
MSGAARSRRDFLRSAFGMAVAAGTWPVLAASSERTFTANEEGGYRFLAGNPVFAAGAVALSGYAFVRAMLRRWLPLDEGFEAIRRHLQSEGRPLRALGGIELRLPRQLSAEEFAEFNAPYIEQLRNWEVMINGFNPISRTNVVPAALEPEQPSVHAFSYCVPSAGASRSFVMSGMTEISANGVTAAGDVSAEGMRRKLSQVVAVVSQRLDELNVAWSDATHIDLYSAHDFGGTPGALMERALGSGLRRGIRHHHGRPPVIGLELELEARGLARELVV